MILKRMKRRHARADTIAFCDAVRRLRPDATFGADLIAGFPTESEAMFQNTLALVDEAGLSALHVFPFSPRQGAPAARMPPLAPGTVRERAARLRAKGDEAMARRLAAMVGQSREILMEYSGQGYTACFAPVRPEGTAVPGTLVRVLLTGVEQGRLTGRLAA
jgi:threonylcarbamoyladenosine tRNA methylthiotransferase MtaB